jgi:hypothetical protein
MDPSLPLKWRWNNFINFLIGLRIGSLSRLADGNWLTNRRNQRARTQFSISWSNYRRVDCDFACRFFIWHILQNMYNKEQRCFYFLRHLILKYRQIEELAKSTINLSLQHERLLCRLGHTFPVMVTCSTDQPIGALQIYALAVEVLLDGIVFSSLIDD